MFRNYTLLFVLVGSVVFAQENSNNQKYGVANDVDTQAEYPGGLTAFFEYLQQEMRYPVDANLKRIEGKVFVAFVVDRSGFIIAGSVTVLKSLDPSCDEEALRVIRISKTKWKPALKAGKPVNQRFVLPVNFSLTPASSSSGPLYSPKYPIKTIVVAKAHHSRDTTGWALYGDFNMNMKIGKALIGDSVKVMGWAPWAYYIEGGTSGGYISWKALKVTEELSPLSKIIEEKSEQLYKPSTRATQLSSGFEKANAVFSLTSDKKSVVVGECVTLTLSFNVHKDNKAPLQFYELAQQLYSILPGALTPDNYFIIRGGIENIEGVSKSINGAPYVTYDIFKASYCATTTGTLSIPALPLQISKVKAQVDGSDSIITFTSKPLSIKINPLPADVKASMHGDVPMVGKFLIKDSLLTEKISAGKPVIYKVTVSGNGLTFPIDAPEIKMPNVSVQLQDLVDYDTIVGDQLISEKSFFYRLVFQKPGAYDFSGKIIFHCFNPVVKKLETLTSSSKVNVVGFDNTEQDELLSPFGSRNHFIAIDASQSMQIEDYTPNRLGAVKNGLKEFLMSREDCNIGLILFGGDAKHFSHTDPRKCFTRRFVDSISFNLSKRGTAIGDAIWLAKNSFQKNQLPKKLVIIGDGDNTAGHISPKLAATIAKKYNITIYTIGVGTTGLVPYGTDALGRKNMIDDTFTDKDFKMISSITNGQYYRAKDGKEVESILKVIFGP